MKIIHLTSVHPAFDTRIFHKQCVTLAKAGYDVTLLAAGCEEQEINGVKICSVPKERSRIARMLKTPWNIYLKAVKSNAEICHFHDPELMPIGMLLRLHGKKVICDVHEDYPRNLLSRFWIPTPLRKTVALLVAAVEWFGARFFFTAIVSPTSTIANRFPIKKTILVRNFPHLQELVVEQNKKYCERSEQIVYIGGLSEVRGIFENIQAMEMISHRSCKLLLGGRFANLDVENKCKNADGWQQVAWKGWVDRKQIANILAESRAGLVVLHPIDCYQHALPIKLFEYMSAGIPVIASDFPLWRKIIDGAQCGLLVDPLQPKAIAEAIDWLLDHPEEAEQMGRNGRKAVVEQYNWETESNTLLELYKKIAT
ncbi:MAG: glycosyltransferase [Candidatus Electrothrix sp. AUS1_2]|nr:glycosyltransferase [Candidatus Electrothrix sp. AUS1_2]